MNHELFLERGNPLALEPGDLIVGYEGIPWKRLYPQLLNAGLPVSLWASLRGSTSASVTHYSMMGVAFNWGIFDTIDVVKYSSGDTLHLSTSLLDTIPHSQPIWPSDQVPVAGVPMPQAPRSAVAVSWGVVQGTNIGYVYVWDWWSSQTRQLFQDAVNDLLHTRGVEGLVLDFRMNFGGDYTVGNRGLSQMFNFDPTVNLRNAVRNSTTNCMSFTLQNFAWGFPPGTLGDLLKTLEAVQSELRRRGVRARWVRPESMHLTLKFLGNIPADHVAGLTDALFAFSRSGAFRLTVAGLGVFPGVRRPRVLWAGLSGAIAALAQLQRELDDRLVIVGFSREERDFHGHRSLLPRS